MNNIYVNSPNSNKHEYFKVKMPIFDKSAFKQIEDKTIIHKSISRNNYVLNSSYKKSMSVS